MRWRDARSSRGLHRDLLKAGLELDREPRVVDREPGLRRERREQLLFLRRSRSPCAVATAICPTSSPRYVTGVT